MMTPVIGSSGTTASAGGSWTIEIERFLRAHQGELHPSHDPAIAAAVIETVVDAIAHKAVLEQSTLLSGSIAAREAFALVMSYLRRPAAR